MYGKAPVHLKMGTQHRKLLSQIDWWFTFVILDLGGYIRRFLRSEPTWETQRSCPKHHSLLSPPKSLRPAMKTVLSKGSPGGGDLGGIPGEEVLIFTNHLMSQREMEAVAICP